MAKKKKPIEKVVTVQAKLDADAVLAEIQEQSDECDSLAREMVTAQEEHKAAKAAYDKAVEQLRRLCRKPDMPLYEDAEKESSPT